LLLEIVRLVRREIALTGQVVPERPPTERQRIIEAARRSTSRSEVCRLVYNSKPSGEAYQKVKQVLDEEGLLLPRKPGQVVEAA
jgi:hypothetical protein